MNINSAKDQRIIKIAVETLNGVLEILPPGHSLTAAISKKVVEGAQRMLNEAGL